jgi:hypothetical protein
VWVTAFAAARPTVESRVLPPAGYVRVAVLPATFAASLRGLELVADTTLLSGDGKTQLCAENMVAATRIGAYQNESDVGVDGIVRLWGEHLWRVKPGSVSFPLDNGQTATWKDWRDGLRPKKRGGRFVFTQVTTPDGSLSNYQGYLSFVAEEMGAIALRRESTPLVDDSLSVGDLLVSVDTEGTSKVGMIVDMCKKPGGERLYLIGSSGTPSATFHILRPYSPVQGVNEWFTLEGAKWAIGQGAKTDLRRVTLK